MLLINHRRDDPKNLFCAFLIEQKSTEKRKYKHAYNHESKESQHNSVFCMEAGASLQG